MNGSWTHLAINQFLRIWRPDSLDRPDSFPAQQARRKSKRRIPGSDAPLHEKIAALVRAFDMRNTVRFSACSQF